jgi:hypothetical protein
MVLNGLQISRSVIIRTASTNQLVSKKQSKLLFTVLDFVARNIFHSRGGGNAEKSKTRKNS